ncbi:MAG: GAF domain-containing protein [Cytophagales bacterium]|nr:MAG: GAF domain-containing protein [Cytophagales bacterium]
MEKLNFRQRLILFSGIVLFFIIIGISLLIYNYLRGAEKVTNLELAVRLEQAATSLSFHALNYADGERTAIIDINNDITDFEAYLTLLKVGGELDFRATLTEVNPFEDEKSRNLISQLEAEWNGYKENLQKITKNPHDQIDEAAQQYIVNNVGKIKGVIKELSDHYYSILQQLTNQHLQYLLLLCLMLIAFVCFEYYRVANFILKPLLSVASQAKSIAKGEFVLSDTKTDTNEVNIIFNALNEITFGLEKITKFAESIGNSNFNASLEARSDKDMLAYSLLEMRNNLLKVNEEEQKRKWINEGLAKFAAILRIDDQDRQILADTIISQLVKYVGANQGGLFAHNEDANTLELLASYAYERKRFVERAVPLGDGLLGQAFIEKDILYLKEIPDGYVTITSGLGEATPSQLLIIPLKINERVFGVIEIASFESFEDYQMEFLEKIAENIAATIATVKINEKTAALLRESQEQSEMLRTQEEEMRQNVEELIATQEQMRQKQQEVEISNQKLMSNERILQKAMEKSRKQGEELQIKNAELALQQQELHKQMHEIELTKDKIEHIREEEQKRTKLLIDQQKRLMAKVMEDFKKKEKELLEQIAKLKND